MSPNLVRQETSTTRIQRMDPLTGVSYGSGVTILQDPATGAEIKEHQFVHTCTDEGLQTTEASRLYQCPCGRTVHFDSTFIFYCNGCNRTLCRAHQVEMITPQGRPVILTGKDRVSDLTIALDVGTCRKCWDESFFNRIAGLVFRIVSSPFRWIGRMLSATIGRAAGVPPKSPTTPTQSPRGRISPIILLLLASVSLTIGATAEFSGAVKLPDSPCTHEGAEMTSNEVPLQLKQVEALLNLAHRIGLDLPHVHPVASILCSEITYQMKQHLVDPGICDQLQRIIDARLKDINERLLVFEQPGPSDNITDGDLHIFQTLFTDTESNLWSGQVQRGMVVAGQTGFGKSTVLRHLARVWASLQRACVLITSKHDQFFWYLARAFPDRCLILRAGIDVFYNPFCPVAGTSPKEFLGVKGSHYACAYSKWESVSVIARLFDIFERECVPSGATAPTLNWLMNTLLSAEFPKKQFNFNLIPSTFQTFTMLKEGGLGKSMACQRGITVHDIWAHDLVVIVDCASLSAADTMFLSCCLLADFRQVKKQNPDFANLLFAIDEADNLMSSNWTDGSHLNPLGSEWVLARQADISTAYGVHVVSVNDPRARANTAVSIIGGLTNSPDVVGAGQSGALDSTQIAAIPHLRPGWAIMKMTGERYSNPYLVTWPMPESFVQFSEAERLAHNSRILKILPPFILENSTHSKPVVTSAPPSTQLTPDQLAVLTDIADRPTMNKTGRAASVKLPSGKDGFKLLSALVRELKQLKLVDEIKVQVNERGSPSIYHYLTNHGLAAIGKSSGQSRPGTGPAHFFLQQFVKALLKDRGIDADIEARRPGSNKEVDIGFADPSTGLAIACEIAVSTHSGEPQQSLRDLGEGGWARVLVLGATSADLMALQRAFQTQLPDPDPRIKLILLHHLVSAHALQDLYDCPDLIPNLKQRKTT